MNRRSSVFQATRRGTRRRRRRRRRTGTHRVPDSSPSPTRENAALPLGVTFEWTHVILLGWDSHDERRFDGRNHERASGSFQMRESVGYFLSLLQVAEFAQPI